MSATATVSLYEDDTQAWGLIEGDALMTLVKLPDHSIDTVVCDPPYGISFRGEAWDGKDITQAVGYRQLTASEAFQRWTSVWAAQCRRVLKPGGHLVSFGAPRTFHRLASGIEDGGLEIRDTLMWLYGTGVPKSRHLPDGRGTTLKPAYEPIVLARAPLDGSVQATTDTWGTGALNIDAARVGEPGYWPANVTLSHAPDCPAALIDAASTGASRLFYCAKTSAAEREAGCEQLHGRQLQIYNGRHHRSRLARNVHPTVKPVSLMRWLVRLAVPHGGVVLDPFTGSGSTGIAAVQEGRMFLGIERESDYIDIACARLTHWAAHAAQGLHCHDGPDGSYLATHINERRSEKGRDNAYKTKPRGARTQQANDASGSDLPAHPRRRRDGAAKQRPLAR